jgi:hypothetical protein
MNKQAILYLFCFLIIAGNCQAQEGYFGFGDTNENMGFQTVERLNDNCSGNSIDQNSLPYRVVSDILRQMGIYDFNFKLRECPNLKNAMAQTLPDENGNTIPYIIYGQDWLKQLSSSTRNWEAIGVLAHEVGHLQKLHVITGKGSKPHLEIEADRFLGAQLAKMGATLPQAQSCLRLTSEKGTRTHPPRSERLQAVELGWSRARLESAHQLTIDTRLSDVTPQLILDRFSKELGGYRALNTLKGISYDMAVSETKTSQKGKIRKYDYTLKVSMDKNTARVVDENQNEQYQLIYGDQMYQDSVRYKRPLDRKQWIQGAPQIGTGTHIKKEDHHFIQENTPPLKLLFDHFNLANNPDIAKFELRSKFEDKECYVLKYNEPQIIEKKLKGKTQFKAAISTTNYYSWQHGHLIASVQEEKIDHYKRENIIKSSKNWIRTTVFEAYANNIGALRLPSAIRQTLQEKKGSALLENGKTERKITLTNIEIINQ